MGRIKHKFWGEFFLVTEEGIPKVGLYLCRKLLIMELVNVVASRKRFLGICRIETVAYYFYVLIGHSTLDLAQ
jgi:hypothetical protein